MKSAHLWAPGSRDVLDRHTSHNRNCLLFYIGIPFLAKLCKQITMRTGPVYVMYVSRTTCSVEEENVTRVASRFGS